MSIETIICNQFFFTDFAFVYSEESYYMDNPVINSGEHNGAYLNSVRRFVHKFRVF